LNAIADVRLWTDDWGAAAEYYEKALTTSRLARDEPTELKSLASLTFVTWLLGRSEQSERNGRALTTLLEAHAKRGILLNSWDEWELVLAALNVHRAVLQMAALSGEPAIAGEAAAELERLIAFYGQMQGRGYIDRTLLREEAISLFYLGIGCRRAGQSERALNAFRRAEAIADRLKSPHVYRIRFEIGIVYEERGEMERARRQYAEALEAFERISGEERLEDLGVALQAQAGWGYERLIRLLLRMGKDGLDPVKAEEAFKWSERERARRLLQLLAQQRITPQESVDKSLAAEERAIGKRIAVIQQNLAGGNLPARRTRELLTDLDNARTTRDGIEAQLAAKSRRYGTLAAPRIATLTELRSSLDAGTAVLEYAIGDDASYV
jgi:tetratricopeptide (TPR) repeat protein